MPVANRIDGLTRTLGYVGMALVLVGAGGIVWLSEAISGTANLPAAGAIGLILPLVLATVLLVIPATRVNLLIWLVAGWWSGLLAALTIFTIEIIFLIATVLLLAAFVRTNW